MTDVIIDPDTGLPQLPENHFWEIVSGLDKDENLFYAFIIADMSNPKKDWVRESVQRKGDFTLIDYYKVTRWYGWRSVGIVDEWSTDGWKMTGVIRNYSETVKEPLARFWPLSAFQIDVVKKLPEYEVVQANPVFKSTLNDPHSFDWTPRSVQRVARQTYMAWQQEIEARRKASEREAKIDAVLGSYPPKSISVVD